MNKIRQFENNTGNRTVILLTGATPTYWPNLYATLEFRCRGRSINTIRNMLRSVSMVQHWANANGSNLDDNLMTGPFISYTDAVAIADFLDFSVETQRLLCQAMPEITGKVTPLRFCRPSERTLSNAGCKTVSRMEKAARIRYVANYMEWMLNFRLSQSDRASSFTDKSFQDNARRAIAALRRLTPRVHQATENEALEAIGNEVCEKIEQALQPTHSANPFCLPFIRSRNYLIWRLFLDTGARLSEIRNLRVDDFCYSTRRLDIRISKTKPRTVHISNELANAFSTFIEEYWSKLPKIARSNALLITDKNGRQLSERSIGAIFQVIRRKVADVPDYLTPHTMRRTWNHRFSLIVDELRLNGEAISHREEEVMRNRLMGWTDGSQMGAKYNRRHIRRRADKVAEQLVNSLGIARPSRD